MQLQCDCGQFTAILRDFPRATPRRQVYSYKERQQFLQHLGLIDLLDALGGTQLVPAYPADLQNTVGRDLIVVLIQPP